LWAFSITLGRRAYRMTFVCKFTRSEIEAVLAEYESGADRHALCARLGISVRTLFRWQAKAGRSSPQLRQLVAQLRDENLRLRQSVGADLEVATLRPVLNRKAVARR